MMGCYDTFRDGNREAQIKALESVFQEYKTGDTIPVRQFDFPLSCTFADWGGTCTKYADHPILKNNPDFNFFGLFVVIEGGIFLYITEEIDNVIYPIFNKFGVLLDDGHGNNYKTILDNHIDSEQELLKDEFMREGLDFEED